MAVFNTSLSRDTGKVIGPGWARELVSATAIVAMTTAMIDNADDDVGLFNLPAGAVVVGATLSMTDMDSAAGLLVSIGDAADEDRLIANTSGQAATITSTLAATGFLFKYAVQTQIRAYVAVASATPVAGTLSCEVRYFVDPEFSTTALVATV